MSYINWGQEGPEQLAIRRQLEEQALYEQAVRMAQAKNRAGNAPGVAGGGGGTATQSCTLVPIFWPTQEESFNEYTITFNEPVTNVSRLTSAFGENAYAHVHVQDFDNVNIYIDLYDYDEQVWVNVWGRNIERHFEENVDYYIGNSIDASFVTIAHVSALKVWSSPEMDQTFHDFDITDKFILHSECPNACSPVRFLRDTVNWEAQGGDSDFGRPEDDAMNIIEFPSIFNVTQLVSAFPDRPLVGGNEAGYAHTHASLETSKLSIDLWDSVNEIWINVWNHQLDNTFYSIDEDSYGYVIGGSISVCFPNIEEVTKMKVYVDFPSDQTYHNWFGEDSFKFYGEGLVL